MLYTFMNRDKELFEVEMENGLAIKLSNLREENKHLLPVFLKPHRDMGVSRKSFNEWWEGRRIPASRYGISKLNFTLNNMSLNKLAEKALGLSLSDQYWIRPSASVRWEEVNFFTNKFSEDIGKLLVEGNWNNGSLVSPDNTSDGVVKKKWKIINGKRCLLKGSSNIITQPQPYREVFASKVAQILFKTFDPSMVVPYWITVEDEKAGSRAYSVCENFITPDTEYVSFNQINAFYKKENKMSQFQFCRSFYGDKAFVLDLMLILDYIVLNEDRHYGNFGMIRSAITGEFLGPAPVFDTGSSLYYDSTRLNVESVESKPFHKSFSQQIKLVATSYYRGPIQEVKDNINHIFRTAFSGSPEGSERLTSMLNSVNKQLDSLLTNSVQSSGIRKSNFFK